MSTFLMAAGGTAGHVHPALAVAHALRALAPEARVVFAGTPVGMESWIVPRAGFALETLRVDPLRGGSWARGVGGALRVPRALLDAFVLLGRVRPDVVLGVGGHVSGVVLAAAAARGVPTVVLEANVVPGLANRLVAGRARFRFGGWRETGARLGEPTQFSGVPVRDEIAGTPRPVSDGALRLLVLGGSLGSSLVNASVVSALSELAARGDGLRIAHQSGEAERDAVRAAYARAGLAARVEAYFESIAEEYAAADLVVSAAGAVTCAELMAAGRASALLPLPVSGHHQRYNAQAMVEAGAALLLEPATIAAPLLALLGDPAQRGRMEERARSLARPDAARVVAAGLLAARR